MSTLTSEPTTKSPWLPPPWFIRLFWFAHRRLFQLTRGRLGLSRPKANRYGLMCVSAVGRRSGQERRVILAYFQDGDNLVTMAMNGWMPPEPAWWLNVQAHPDVRIDTVDGPKFVTGRGAHGEERERLWDRWGQIDKHLDAYAARRPTETAVVVFEPRK
jgi:deazaflavin-dependent oxidoreductase (nitroreductase family)